MGENWAFMAAMLVFSLLFLFHGLILLFVPGRYLPLYTFGAADIRLTRKPALYLGRRLAGLVLTAGTVRIPMRYAIFVMLHPKVSPLSYGQSLLPPGMARWDLLGVAVFAIICAFLLWMNPEKTVKILFTADQSLLEDKITLRLWTLYVQTSAGACMVWSLLPAAAFMKSIR